MSKNENNNTNKNNHVNGENGERSGYFKAMWINFAPAPPFPQEKKSDYNSRLEWQLQSTLNWSSLLFPVERGAWLMFILILLGVTRARKGKIDQSYPNIKRGCLYHLFEINDAI